MPLGYGPLTLTSSPFWKPVSDDDQRMAVAFGMDAKADAGLDRNTIASEKLEKMPRKG